MSHSDMHFVPPYPANALEPVISQNALQMHFMLAQGYSTRAPILLSGVATAAQAGPSQIRAQLRDLSFEASGDVLHRVFFANITPGGSATQPHDNTLALISRSYQDVARFHEIFTAAAAAVQGPGWTLLGWHPGYGELMILNIEEHNEKFVPGILPVLIIDVWEHAYLLDYGTDRAKWIAAWWPIINWNDVERRLVAALNGMLPM